MLLGSQLSTPPLGPALIAAAIWVGHLLTHGIVLAVSDFDVRRVGWGNVVGPLLIDWIIGSILVGTVLATITFCASHWMLGAVRARR